MFPMFPVGQRYQEDIIRAAKFHKAEISLSENDEYVTLSAQIPQTNLKYIRNFYFWQWFFNMTMRNPLLMGSVYSCEFLSDWKPQTVVPLSWWKRLLKFFGFRASEKIRPATGKLIETTVGLTVSVRLGIFLQLSKIEFDKLRSSGLTCVKEIKGDTFPYRLHLGGNVLSVKIKK